MKSIINESQAICKWLDLKKLCLLQEINIVVDDQDLTSTELTCMIDLLCTLQYHFYIFVFMLAFARCENLHVS